MKFYKDWYGSRALIQLVNSAKVIRIEKNKDKFVITPGGGLNLLRATAGLLEGFHENTDDITEDDIDLAYELYTHDKKMFAIGIINYLHIAGLKFFKIEDTPYIIINDELMYIDESIINPEPLDRNLVKHLVMSKFNGQNAIDLSADLEYVDDFVLSVIHYRSQLVRDGGKYCKIKDYITFTLFCRLIDIDYRSFDQDQLDNIIRYNVEQ